MPRPSPTTIVARVACPTCHAPAGSWCVDSDGREKRDETGDWLCIDRRLPRGRPRTRPAPDPDAPKRARGGQPKAAGEARTRVLSFRVRAATGEALDALAASLERTTGDVAAEMIEAGVADG